MKYLFSFILVIFCSNLFAQGEIDEEKKLFYRNEWTFGFLLKNNGVGLSYRYGKHLDGFNKRTYEIDFNYLWHPKEARVQSNVPGGDSFLYGKKNQCFHFRGGFGKQKEIFGKHDKGGVAVRLNYSIGGIIAFLKPVYYEALLDNTGTHFGDLTFKEAKDKDVDQWILGTSSWFMGIEDTKLIPGAYLKAALSFEFGKQDIIIHCIEAGITVEGYMQELEMMAEAYNEQFFLNLFISYRFGRIINKDRKPEVMEVE